MTSWQNNAKMRTPNRKTPLAFYAYNRPDHTARALDALAACLRKDEFEFYFFSDGARNAEAEADVAEVRRVLTANADRFSAQIIERPTNLGLARSIVNGVSRLCESHGRVVVLEDDLIVSPDFLHYMVSALDHYENENNVMQVAGYTVAPPQQLDTDVFLLPVTTTWGWGTWQRAWEKFSWTPEGWPEKKNNEQWLSSFQINGAGNYVLMLEDRLAGRNNSWGILWWYAVSRCGGEVVYPGNSLVWNDGFDGSGVHCGSGSALGQEASPLDAESLPGVLTYPSQSQHHPQHLELLENVLRGKTTVSSRLQSKIQFLWQRLRERISHAFG